jgi:hypothetical protein
VRKGRRPNLLNVVHISSLAHLPHSLPGIITTMTMATWSLDIEQEVGMRYDLCFTLFLTAVAFKLVQADLIPRVSYLTYLDVYTFMNFAFILMAVIFHFSANYYPDIDNVLRYVFFGLWVAANIVFGVSTLQVRSYNWGLYFDIFDRYFKDDEVWFFQELASRK